MRLHRDTFVEENCNEVSSRLKSEVCTCPRVCPRGQCIVIKDSGQCRGGCVACTNLGDVLGDDDQAHHHADVGQHGEDGQDPEVLDEDQQHQDGREGNHVESRVHGGCQKHCVIVVAVVGCAINCFHYLRKE